MMFKSMIELGSLDPAAIQFMLQKSSARQSGCFIMIEVTGKGRACIPEGLTKASRWLKST